MHRLLAAHTPVPVAGLLGKANPRLGERASREPALPWDTAALTAQPRFAAAWRDPWGDIPLPPANSSLPPLPSPHPLRGLLALWEMQTTPDGGDDQPGRFPLPLHQGSLCKNPIIRHKLGPSSHLPGARRGCWGPA